MDTLTYDYPITIKEAEQDLRDEILQYLRDQNNAVSISTLIRHAWGQYYSDREVLNEVLRLLRERKVILTEDSKIALN